VSWWILSSSRCQFGVDQLSSDPTQLYASQTAQRRRLLSILVLVHAVSHCQARSRGGGGALAPNRRLSGFFTEKLALLGDIGPRTSFIQYNSVLSTRSVMWASNMHRIWSPLGEFQVLKATTKKVKFFKEKSIPSQLLCPPQCNPGYAPAYTDNTPVFWLLNT